MLYVAGFRGGTSLEPLILLFAKNWVSVCKKVYGASVVVWASSLSSCFILLISRRGDVTFTDHLILFTEHVSYLRVSNAVRGCKNLTYFLFYRIEKNALKIEVFQWQTSRFRSLRKSGLSWRKGEKSLIFYSNYLVIDV